MKSAVQVEANTVADIEFQAASSDIWDAKYRLCAKDGAKIDQNIDDTYQRVARAHRSFISRIVKMYFLLKGLRFTLVDEYEVLC